MSDVTVWSMFAYRNEDETIDGVQDAERRMVSEWRVEDVFRWARFRGYDTILFTRQSEAVSFQRPLPPGAVKHSSDA